jgi:pimeloyl-ACP methyl ester carboxylesterase
MIFIKIIRKAICEGIDDLRYREFSNVRLKPISGGPVTLVGHSYGGEVITNAAFNNPNVTGPSLMRSV